MNNMRRPSSSLIPSMQTEISHAGHAVMAFKKLSQHESANNHNGTWGTRQASHSTQIFGTIQPRDDQEVLLHWPGKTTSTKEIEVLIPLPNHTIAIISSTIFPITTGIVPHPSTLPRSPRDAWLAVIMQDLLGLQTSGNYRLMRFIERWGGAMPMYSGSLPRPRCPMMLIGISASLSRSNPMIKPNRGKNEKPKNKKFSRRDNADSS